MRKRKEERERGVTDPLFQKSGLPILQKWSLGSSLHHILYVLCLYAYMFGRHIDTCTIYQMNHALSVGKALAVILRLRLRKHGKVREREEGGEEIEKEEEEGVLSLKGPADRVKFWYTERVFLLYLLVLGMPIFSGIMA